MTGLQSSINPDAVRAALARVLASERFQKCEAQARLLRLAVEKSLAGRPCNLKAGPAAKLRTRLAEYYAAEGLRDDVRIELPEDGSPAIFTSIAPPTVERARPRWLWIPAAVAAAALLFWAGTWWRARMASEAVRSLAVLPFQGEEWLGASFSGEIIDDLARVPGLHVTARGSALRAQGRQLDVAAVLEGSVRRSGHDLHVSLQMTRTSDGYRLWSASFERSSRDIPAVEQTVAAAIARRLGVRFPAQSAHRHQPLEPAYQAYLQGRYSFDQSAPEALNHAAERLEEATRLDPEFARAWAWLSIVREYRVAAGMARPNQAMPGSRDAAERAVALEPDSGEAHLALGIVKLQYDWDWAGAKEELDHALEAFPESAFALAWRARWFETQGRMNEAVAETTRALALDPLSRAALDDAAAEYVALKQPNRALSFAQKAVDLNPDDPAARATLANVLLAAGQKDKSRQVVEQLRASAGAKLPPSVLPALVARMGDPEDARRLLDQAEDLPDDELMPAVAYAELAGSIQDWDRLFSWTQEAFGERDLDLAYWLASPLMPKSDPRFDAFLAEMNLPAPSAH